MAGFYIDMAINVAIFLISMIILVRHFMKEPEQEVLVGVKTFRFFTTLSNLFSALVCFMIVIVSIRMALKGCAFCLPSWLHILKFMSTQAVMLTFFTVMVFLGPVKGFGRQLRGASFYMHVVGPLLAFVSLCFLENQEKLTLGQAFVAMLPTVLYAGLYLYKVLILGEDNGGWPDFYGFNRGGKWKISATLMIVGSLVTSLLIMTTHNYLKGI